MRPPGSPLVASIITSPCRGAEGKVERDDSRFRSQVWQNHERMGDQIVDPREIPLLRDLVNSYSRDRWVFGERGPPFPSG